MSSTDAKLDHIIELFTQRFDTVDQRFKSMNERFDAVDRRLESLKNNYRDLKDELKEVKLDIRDVKQVVKEDQKQIADLYNSRDKVTVSFTRAWANASFFIALIASTIVLAVAKAF